MKLIHRLLSAAAAAVIVSTAYTALPSVSAYAQMDYSEFAAGYSHPTEMRGLTALQLVSDMGAGWNLGNSLESANNETYWSNPATTKAMIDKIAAAGFTTLRIPVRWDDHYTDGYNIDSAFMDRVETVVNYGLANGMYVILNCHHNDLQTKVSTDASTKQQVKQELSSIWTQIAQHFADYGDKLIFETNNEPRIGEDWTGSDELYSVVNEYNEAARAAIRATGGNNSARLITMPTYCASGDLAKINGWENSSGDSMVAVSVHAYLPFDFAFSGDGHSDWRESDYTELSALFDRLDKRFLKNGIPVILDEFGACSKNNTADREKYAAIYTSFARRFAEQDIPCVWWDNNSFGTGSENFGIFDRGSCSFKYQGIANNIVDSYKGDPSCEKTSAGETVLFSGSSTADSWGQPVSFDASAVAGLDAGDRLECSYSGSTPELILQSFTNSAKGWVKIAPDSDSGSLAVWNYSSILSAYGDGFSDLGKVYIGAGSSALTVTKVAQVSAAGGHTHDYSGERTVTIQPTATTRGRAAVKCSYQQCSQVKIEMLPAVSAPSVTGVKAESGDGQVKLTWDKTDGADVYMAYYFAPGGKLTAIGGGTYGTTKTATGLVNGTKYGFLVRARVNGVWTPFTSADFVYAVPQAAVKPAVKTEPGNGQVKLTWDKIDGADVYMAYYFAPGGKLTAIGGGTYGTTKTATGLTNGTKYGFLVRARVNGVWTPFTSADFVYAVPKA